MSCRAFTVLAMVALAGCAEDREPGVAADDFDAAVRAQMCDSLLACGEVRDRAMCDRLELPAGWPALTADDRADLDAGVVEWDAAAAARCVRQRPSCDKTSRAVAPMCEPLLVGHLHDGQSCRRDEACASRRCSRPGCTGPCCTGMCIGDAPPSPGYLGDLCHGGSCVVGRCDGDRCVPFTASGGLCAGDAECASGLVCRRVTSTSELACAPLPTTGDACEGECALRGDVCRTATLACTPGGLDGDTCANDGGCQPYYRCDQTTLPTSCKRLEAAIGERCDYLPCVRGARCTGVCEADPPAAPTCP